MMSRPLYLTTDSLFDARFLLFNIQSTGAMNSFQGCVSYLKKINIPSRGYGLSS
ncbi:hypothetical protein BJX62DRAFT_212218 [Aspergillus germanicus]